VGPRIEEKFDDEDIYFQQDGASPHYHHDVRAYFDAVRPNRWIGRRGSVPLTSHRWTACYGDTLKITFMAENQQHSMS
jgi:hypothetical protein